MHPPSDTLRKKRLVPQSVMSNNKRILIVGSGIFGVSTAIAFLKEGGYDVQVIDRSTVLPAVDAASTDLNKVRMNSGMTSLLDFTQKLVIRLQRIRSLEQEIMPIWSSLAYLLRLSTNGRSLSGRGAITKQVRPFLLSDPDRLAHYVVRS